MAKLRAPATIKRVYERVFICMKCNAKIRSDVLRVKAGKVKCRKCNSKQLRVKKKDRKM